MFNDKLPVTPYGISAAQTWQQVAGYFEIIEQYNIKAFVELGIHVGGLTSLLLPRAEYTDFRYLGVESNQSIVNPAIIQKIARLPSTNVVWSDCFTDVTRDRVKTFVDNSPGACLILCDNGNKIKEMEFYAQVLRIGDYITVHDYGTEITDSDLVWIDNSPDYEQVKPELWRKQIGLPLYRRTG